MIQTHHYQAPHSWDTTQPAVDAATQHAQRLALIHPALRGTRIEATPTHIDMWLRIASTDRWRINAAARIIATSLLRNMKLPPQTAVLVGVETVGNNRALNREEGRSPNHTPRGSRRRVASPPDP